MIVRDGFIFFPLIHRWSAHQHYIFTLDRRRGLETERDYRQQAHEYETFHHFWPKEYLCRARNSATVAAIGHRGVPASPMPATADQFSRAPDLPLFAPSESAQIYCR